MSHKARTIAKKRTIKAVEKNYYSNISITKYVDLSRGPFLEFS